MRPLRRTAFAAALLACACAAPFRAGAPVEVDRHWYGVTYRQDGKAVRLFSLLDGLERVDASRVDARAARGTIEAGAVATVAGALALGFGLGGALNDGGKGDVALAVGGAALWFVGDFVARRGFDQLDRAVGAYDGQLGSVAPRAAWTPWLGPIRADGGRCLAGGIAIRF